MNDQGWLWIGKYIIVIVVALVLGAVLGGLEPFRSTTIGSAHVTAGTLVQFIAHSGALALLWALGYRHARQLARGSGGAAHLAGASLALMTLVVTASFHEVLLHFAAPLLAADTRTAIDWGFIAAIVAAAGWLLWALFTKSEAALATAGRRAASARPGHGSTVG